MRRHLVLCYTITMMLLLLNLARAYTSPTRPRCTRLAAVRLLAAAKGESTPLPWFAPDGLSFSCSMCGNCCSGSSGSVRFTEQEGEAMAAKKNMNMEEFNASFTRQRGSARTGKYRELKETKSVGGLDCIFLDRDSMPGKAICSLYDARPTQCKTWPFWSEIVENKESWSDCKPQNAADKDGCPGLGKGDKVSVASILKQVSETEEWRLSLDSKEKS